MVRHGDDLTPLKGRKPVAVLSHNIHRDLPLEEDQRNYPDRFPRRLEHMLSDFKGVPEASLMVTAGATAGLYLLASAFKRKVEVLILEPAYSGYEEAFSAYGHTIRNYPLGIEFNAESVQIPETVDVVVLGNPNNPTGTYQNLKSWVERNPGKLFIVDESFIQFTDEKYSLRPLAIKLDHLIVIESLTKFYGMAGIRLGLLYGAEQTISKLKPYQVPWSVTVTESFMRKRLDQTKHLFEAYHNEKAYVYKQLTDMNLKFYPGEANYYLLETENEAYVFEGLLNKGILTRRVHNFKGIEAKYLRIAIGTRDENEALLCALKGLQMEKGVL